jgi:hypothetical protein
MSVTAKFPKDKLYKNITIRCNGVHLVLNLEVKSLLCLPSKSSFSRGNIKQYILKERVIEKLPKLDPESSEKKRALFSFHSLFLYHLKTNTSRQYPPSGGAL